nr:ABC transporter ATP-binding protein [Kocuria atrinae]
MTETAIRYSGVSKVYPNGTTAVDHLDLEIPTGSLTVFVGPSGCGKTTSLRMLNRMVEPSSGTVEVNGRNVADIPAAQLRRSMGYVMQQSGLMPHRTVEDNIATVPRLNGVSKSTARANARELLGSVGLDESLATRYPAQLSGGQQQRVGVARALAADPPILLMDEPFSAVDPVVRQDLQRELLDLQKRLHRTIVFVTHDIDEAITLGNRVAVFARGGKLAQYATPEELLRAPADDFVADFIGRDRGFRSLTFDRAPVAVHPVTVLNAETGQRSRVDSGHGASAPWEPTALRAVLTTPPTTSRTPACETVRERRRRRVGSCWSTNGTHRWDGCPWTVPGPRRRAKSCAWVARFGAPAIHCVPPWTPRCPRPPARPWPFTRTAPWPASCAVTKSCGQSRSNATSASTGGSSRELAVE